MFHKLITALPAETISHIFSFISNNDAIQLCLVSKEVYHLAVPHIWGTVGSFAQFLVLGRPEYLHSHLKASMDPQNKGIFTCIQTLELNFSQIATLTKLDLHTLRAFMDQLRQRAYSSDRLFPNLERLIYGHIHDEETQLAHSFDYGLLQMELWNMLVRSIPDDCQIMAFMTDMLSGYLPPVHKTHLLIDNHYHQQNSNHLCCLIDWSPIQAWEGIETLTVLLETIPPQLWHALSNLPNLICLDISSTTVHDYVLFPFPALKELKAGQVLNRSCSRFIPSSLLKRLRSLDLSIEPDLTQEDLILEQIRRVPHYARQELLRLCQSAVQLEALTLRGWKYDLLDILPLIHPILPQLRVEFRLIDFHVRPSVTQALRRIIPPEAEFEASCAFSNPEGSGEVFLLAWKI